MMPYIGLSLFFHMTKRVKLESATMMILVCTIGVISKLVNVHVDQPYMDEIFHVPQTQSYCQGMYAMFSHSSVMKCMLECMTPHMSDCALHTLRYCVCVLQPVFFRCMHMYV